MRTNRSPRPAVRAGVLAILTAALVVPNLIATHRTAAAAAGGDPLISEAFTGSSVMDPRFVALGSGYTPCLTASTTTQTGSAIQACAAGQQAIGSGGDGDGSGALRLTDAGNDEAGALLYNKALPLSEGAQISFDFAMYGGQVNPRADGIAFFLADGTADLTAAGADGGSLGYAQKTGAGQADDAPGVMGGFLGLGLDERGNYELDTEGRGTTGGGTSALGTDACPNPSTGPTVVNSVGLRGPGTGYDGYCLLGRAALNPTTQSLLGAGPNRTSPNTLDGARITVDPPGPGAEVTVSLAFNVTTTTPTYTQVFQVAEPADAPATFKFGVSATTGQKSDIHEISNLTVNSVEPLPVLSITQSDTSNGTFEAGQAGTLLIDSAVGQVAAEPEAPTVSDTLPAGLTVASIPTVTGFDCSATVVGSQTLSCTYTGSLPLATGTALPEIPLDVAVARTATGILTSTASIASTDAAPVSASHAVTVTRPPAPTGTARTGRTGAGVTLHGTSLLPPASGSGPFTTVKASNPVHGAVSVASDGSYTYTPAAGFSGVDSFTYVIDDAYGSSSAPVTVTITVVPTAVGDSATVRENGSLTAPTVLSNDHGTGLTAALMSEPAHGTVTLAPNGTYTYTPDPGYVGPDSFRYVADGAGGTSAPATVSITVTGVAPVVTGGTQQTIPVGGKPAPITFTPGGGTVTTTAPGSLPPGVSLQPTGALTGTPTRVGTYTFPVTVTGPAGGTTTVLVSITVEPVATPAGALPFTGVAAEQLSSLGGLLGAAGAVLTVAGRRRQGRQRRQGPRGRHRRC